MMMDVARHRCPGRLWSLVTHHRFLFRGRSQSLKVVLPVAHPERKVVVSLRGTKLILRSEMTTLAERYPKRRRVAAIQSRSRAGRPCHRDRSGISARVSLLLLLLFLAMVVLSGCNIIGYMYHAIPRKTKAVYRLEDRPTFILVDDPANVLGSPTYSTQIAREIHDALAKKRVVRELIHPQAINSLIAMMGEAYHDAAVDEIGTEVGAAQVIHVHVQSATIYPEPGLLKPTGLVRVKVIDVVKHKRLFPTMSNISGAESAGKTTGAGDVPGTGAGLPGYRIQSHLPPRGLPDSSRATRDLAWSRLASIIARDTARLFHDFLPRQPNEPFE